MTATFTIQIEVDEQGVAWIGGTRVKVIEVVLDKIAYGWSPDEIYLQYPPLSLAQIHAALTYYYENQASLDAQILASARKSEALAKDLSNQEFRQRLSRLR